MYNEKEKGFKRERKEREEEREREKERERERPGEPRRSCEREEKSQAGLQFRESLGTWIG
eukprot:109592-Amorphochlora_amoeboformis.AAC.1